MKENQYSFATWLRAFGVILILLCHFTQQNENPYVVMSSQFFNIGNSIFFILSGFLFGVKGGIKGSALSWYKKRIKRIYIPYEMMVITLFIIYLVLKKSIQWKLWIPQFIGIHGWKGVFGATQTWFVTAILICYLFTPIVSKIVFKMWGKRRNIVILCISTILLPIPMAYLLHDVYSLIVPLFWYTLAFIVGSYFNNFHLTFKKTTVLFCIMILGFLARIVARIYYDNTIFYTQIIAGYTHVLGAFCIFFIFAYLFRKKKAPCVVQFMSDTSFEIYLWHYMFVDGPLRLFGITTSWIFDCLLVFVVTLIISVVAKRAEKLIVSGFEMSLR